MRFLYSQMAIYLLLASMISTAVAQEIPDISASNIHLRGTLSNCKLVFEQAGKGHVAFIGGSITYMNGYRPMVCKLLQQRYPKTEFQFTNAGISSTCSTTGAHRLTRDVLTHGDVDLVFVEFAVNDDQDAQHDEIHAIRGMEGLIAQIRRHNPNADIVVTHFANLSMMETMRKGEEPISIAAHNKVCEHYQVSTVNLCRELVQLIDDDKTTWALYGGVHPKPYGNAICTAMIAKLLEHAWTKPIDKLIKHPLPTKSLDQASYIWGQLNEPATARYDENWQVSIPDWKSIKGSFRSQFAGLKLLHAEKPHSEFKYTFEGTSLGAYVLAGPDAGVLEVYIDDHENPRSVNLYHRHSAGLHYPRTVMLAEGLMSGWHTVRVRIRQPRDAKSQGSSVRILNFAINAKK